MGWLWISYLERQITVYWKIFLHFILNPIVTGEFVILNIFEKKHNQFGLILNGGKSSVEVVKGQK